nr:hypothetical protein Iba_chr06bCG9940 [Ipomoea batatas]
MGPVEEELDFLGGQADEANQNMSQVEEKLDVVHESMLTLKNIMIDDAKKGEGSVSSEEFTCWRANSGANAVMDEAQMQYNVEWILNHSNKMFESYQEHIFKSIRHGEEQNVIKEHSQSNSTIEHGQREQ